MATFKYGFESDFSGLALSEYLLDGHIYKEKEKNMLLNYLSLNERKWTNIHESYKDNLKWINLPVDYFVSQL